MKWKFENLVFKDELVVAGRTTVFGAGFGKIGIRASVERSTQTPNPPETLVDSSAARGYSTLLSLREGVMTNLTPPTSRSFYFSRYIVCRRVAKFRKKSEHASRRPRLFLKPRIFVRGLTPS